MVDQAPKCSICEINVTRPCKIQPKGHIGIKYTINCNDCQTKMGQAMRRKILQQFTDASTQTPQVKRKIVEDSSDDEMPKYVKYNMTEFKKLKRQYIQMEEKLASYAKNFREQFDAELNDD